MGTRAFPLLCGLHNGQYFGTIWCIALHCIGRWQSLYSCLTLAVCLAWHHPHRYPSKNGHSDSCYRCCRRRPWEFLHRPGCRLKMVAEDAWLRTTISAEGVPCDEVSCFHWLFSCWVDASTSSETRAFKSALTWDNWTSVPVPTPNARHALMRTSSYSFGPPTLAPVWSTTWEKPATDANNACRSRHHTLHQHNKDAFQMIRRETIGSHRTSHAEYLHGLETTISPQRMQSEEQSSMDGTPCGVCKHDVRCSRLHERERSNSMPGHSCLNGQSLF